LVKLRGDAVNQADQVERLPLAGYPIVTVTADALRVILEERFAAARKTVLLFANTNFVVNCTSIRSWLCREEVILVNDGVGLDIAALLLYRRRYRENLNGTDFSPYFLGNCPARRRIFLLGGKPGIAEKAGRVIARDFGHQVAGCVDGYSEIDPADLCAAINRSGAEIVLVAMGNPKQEEWIHANLNALDARLVMGVGALFDFLSGGVKRAPRWIRQLRCEWLYRLYQEPTRLLRRYTVDIVSFLFLCLNYPRREKV